MRGIGRVLPVAVVVGLYSGLVLLEQRRSVGKLSLCSIGLVAALLAVCVLVWLVAILQAM